MDDLAWHAHSADDAIRQLKTRRSGLTEAEATDRLAEFGPNRLVRIAPVSALRVLGHQFTSIVVLLLAAAALISIAMGEPGEAIAIAVVIVINTAIGFVTEFRARRAMDALLQFEIPHATVVRATVRCRIASSQLVPGDVIELRAGQAVPADARIIGATELRADEAALTGESLPIAKHAPPTLPAETPLADRRNMVYMGTVIAAGAANAVVTATGEATELGRIGTLVAGIQEERTPLERRLDALGHRLVWLAVGVAALVAVLEALQGAPLGVVIETGIALAVAAVPEALPVVATIALAVGLRRMANRHGLVRRLPAVEALGSTTVICTDKTRTLTSGEMTVVTVWTAEVSYDTREQLAAGAAEPHLSSALKAAVFASRRQAESSADSPAGTVDDPVDRAIFKLANSCGLDPAGLEAARQTVGSIPFSSDRKLAASFDRIDDDTVAFVKGAPGRLLALSDSVCTNTGDRRLDDAGRMRLLAINDTLAGAGLRVLGLARGRVARAEESALEHLTFIGFLGLMDPPAAGVKDSIARLRDAGLRTVMITGDQRLTAQAIGRELGLLTSDDDILDGRELHGLTSAALAARLGQVGAFSRVTPEDKLLIVEALQARGDIVAMIGDGVNDAAALKRADVGVAMGGRGTDVAKQAAAIVLQDDRFETIVAAVEEGRIIYDNIRKFVFYLFSCNLAEILVLLVAGIAGLPVPLSPLQILWMNIVTDTLPALALAVEPGDRHVMRRAPRDPREAILSRRFAGQITLYAGLISGSTLAAYLWAMAYAPTHAATMAFMTLALAQVFHLGNARNDRTVLRPAQVISNPYAIGAVLASVALQIAPAGIDSLGAVLDVVTLSIGEWIVVLAASAVTALVGQTIRLVSARHRR